MRETAARVRGHSLRQGQNLFGVYSRERAGVQERIQVGKGKGQRRSPWEGQVFLLGAESKAESPSAQISWLSLNPQPSCYMVWKETQPLQLPEAPAHEQRVPSLQFQTAPVGGRETGAQGHSQSVKLWFRAGRNRGQAAPARQQPPLLLQRLPVNTLS